MLGDVIHVANFRRFIAHGISQFLVLEPRLGGGESVGDQGRIQAATGRPYARPLFFSG